MKYKLLAVVTLLALMLVGCNGTAAIEDESAEPGPEPAPEVVVLPEVIDPLTEPYNDGKWEVSAKVMWVDSKGAGLQVKMTQIMEGAARPTVHMRLREDMSECPGGYFESVGGVDIYKFDFTDGNTFDSYDVCVESDVILCENMDIEVGYIDSLENSKYVRLDYTWYEVVSSEAGTLVLRRPDEYPIEVIPQVTVDRFQFVDAQDGAEITSVKVQVNGDNELVVSYAASIDLAGSKLLYNYCNSGSLVVLGG